jgi:hypothetical protein
LGPILTVGGLARQQEKYRDCYNPMRARTNRTELPSGRRFDNATSNRSEVGLEHDKRMMAQVTGLMHGRLAGPHEPGERLPRLAALQFLGGPAAEALYHPACYPCAGLYSLSRAHNIQLK